MDQFFLTINSWMGQGPFWGALGCFLWGMVSVLFSPCHLASIPLIIGYVGGQNQLIEGRKAVLYAIVFTTGLFITIAAVGLVCSLLGRMLGDVGPYWTIAIGLLLIWVALDIFGIAKCSLPGGHLSRLTIKGLTGAFVLGLAYGVLSGSCTFGFIAPILAIVSVQAKVFTGVLFILLFAIGHCIPIVVAGSSTALVKCLLASSRWQQGGRFFRRLAGTLIMLLGIYFVVQPFFN
ncbi:MAG: cytochrome c biogenesis protein CcdA [Desulfobulbus sp.]|nr:cytochrome c biogenesis protein CcdA [Desulfobulbus sp.]